MKIIKILPIFLFIFYNNVFAGCGASKGLGEPMNEKPAEKPFDVSHYVEELQQQPILPKPQAATTPRLPNNFFRFKIYEHHVQNERPAMEDRFNIFEDEKRIFAGIYDGHGGSFVSECLQGNLQACIFEIIDKYWLNREVFSLSFATVESALKNREEAIKQGSCATCVYIDKQNNTAYFINLGDSRGVLVSIADLRQQIIDLMLKKKEIEF
ncbi:TPA: hypothetical protein DEO28_04035 [Candidatus Dependentiae bacterium]|nr:MAG: hypothetical protein UR14_C0006G0044 [candidate division TM6 bacterium GW2011_GWE2_31_21]KKP53533.1 MAG: hypothetical protein UR43_C0004G0074 [candidate division TM6 bacterium GW2011_GWF2_33_332]HBS48226.1 hypothetical protein [Candidatus Dependentiae bacterium]HBZ73652.1 hypothetical protein [Candidatus Dependentiae bacterium]